MAVEVCMSQESVWFDQMKYEDAEARYQEIVADRHAGLHVEVGDFVTFSGGIYNSGSYFSHEVASFIINNKERTKMRSCYITLH